MFKSVLPILKRGGVAVGREILNAGTNFINDIGNNVSPRAAFNSRAKETVEKLKRKVMYGEGFKGGNYPKKRQLIATPRKKKAKAKGSKVKKNKSGKVVKKGKVTKKKSTKSKSKNKKVRDIFSI